MCDGERASAACHHPSSAPGRSPCIPRLPCWILLEIPPRSGNPPAHKCPRAPRCLGLAFKALPAWPQPPSSASCSAFLTKPSHTGGRAQHGDSFCSPTPAHEAPLPGTGLGLEPCSSPQLQPTAPSSFSLHQFVLRVFHPAGQGSQRSGTWALPQRTGPGAGSLPRKQTIEGWLGRLQALPRGSCESRSGNSLILGQVRACHPHLGDLFLSSDHTRASGSIPRGPA